MADKYFSVKDMAFVGLEPLDPEQLSITEYFPNYRSLGIENDLQQLLQRNHQLIDELTQPKLQEILHNFEDVCQLLSKTLIAQQLSLDSLQAQKVMISENEITLLWPKAFNKEQSLALMLIFSPNYQSFFIEARVIACQERTNGFLLKLSIAHPRESSRRRLAAHIVEQQRFALAKKRQG